jgi:hypothetical protein
MIEYYDENHIPMMNPESIFQKRHREYKHSIKIRPSLTLLDIFKDLNKRRIFEPNVST